MPSRRRFLHGSASLAALAALMPWLPSSAFASGTLLSRAIPSSGELLPVIGLGTSRTHDVAMTDEALQPLREVLQTLVNGGASLVDTAPSYGRAEAVCGALAAEDDMRKKLFLASKVSSSGRTAGERQVEASFAALKSQRFRWAFGAMQILKGHWRSLFGRSKLDSGQRYHFITGWFSWFGDALQLVFAMGAIAWTAAMLIWPKLFSLPVTIMLAPVLGLLVAKAAMGPILYRRAMDCPWADIAGASLVSLGLSHSIARGVIAGLTHKRGVFLRTAKGRGESGLAKFFQPIREEMYLLVALIAAAWAMIMLRGTQNIEVVLWVTMLGLQSLPYIAALACQFIAQLPEKPLPAASATQAA